jgi:predicted membrane protein
MENIPEKRFTNQPMKKVAFGVVVVAAGLLLLAFNFDILPMDFKHIIFSWQMLLIAIGVISLIGREGRGPGYILIAIGAFFMIPELFDFHISFVRLFWPVLLIVIGILILLNRGGRYHGNRHHEHPGWKHNHHGWGHNRGDNWEDTIGLDEGYINETNIFSGSKHKVIHQEFKGGRISNVFGGTEIDLTQATLAEGRNELYIECIFGGVTLIVPSDWKVVMNVSSVLGGFSDKRSIVKENPDSTRILVIRGSAIFGGGEIKSY